MGSRPSILFFLASILAGAAGAISFTASDKGMISGEWFPLVLIAVVMLLILGLLLRGSPAVRVGRLLLGPIVIVFSWMVFGLVLPDPAVVYFYVFSKKIEADWKTDPVTKVVYFPIDYTLDDGGRKFPRNFYVLDNAGTFAADKYGSGRLISPKCNGSKYSMKSIWESVLFLRFYIDDPNEPVRSCLITPMSNVN